MTIQVSPRRRARVASPPPIARDSAAGSVLVACPDSRSPAYEAAAGLAGAGRLGRFETGFYYKGHGPLSEVARRYVPCHFHKLRRRLLRRNDRRIPAGDVVSRPSFDLSLALENRLDSPALRRSLTRHRTRRFDRALARSIERNRPGAVLAFSDVGSDFALPTCRRLGVPTILSMVHGEVGEEIEVVAIERDRSPAMFPFYLGDGRLDLELLAWFHDRRRRDLDGADRVLVPSGHVADRLVAAGRDRSTLDVVPYAADTRRFRPHPAREDRPGCTFLFAGGICGRKGLGDLLNAWSLVRRDGWRLQLVGALPAGLASEVEATGAESLGRVGHREMPAAYDGADVFVFPSLFEGSAVVTYEALASGLPSVTTLASGTVARDGVEAMIVPPRDPEALARAMVRLGEDRPLRLALGRAAWARADEFTRERYHAGLIRSLDRAIADRRGPSYR